MYCLLLALIHCKVSCTSLEFSMVSPTAAHITSKHILQSCLCPSIQPSYAPQESQIHFSPVDIKCQNPAGFDDVNAFSPLSLRSLSRNHLTLDTGYVIILNKLPKERENEQFFNHFSSSAKLELYTDFSIFSVCLLSVCLLLRDSNTVGVTVVLKNQPFHKITDFTM